MLPANEIEKVFAPVMDACHYKILHWTHLATLQPRSVSADRVWSLIYCLVSHSTLLVLLYCRFLPRLMIHITIPPLHYGYTSQTSRAYMQHAGIWTHHTHVSNCKTARRPGIWCLLCIGLRLSPTDWGRRRLVCVSRRIRRFLWPHVMGSRSSLYVFVLKKNFGFFFFWSF